MLICFFHLSTARLNGIHDPGLEGEMLWRAALGQMRQLEYGLHSGCSFCLSLYTHTHTHTHTRQLKARHTCVSVSWKCVTTTRSSTDVKDLTLFNWAANHGIVFIYTHTPHFQKFCSPQSGPTRSKWSQENFQPVLRRLQVSILDSGTLARPAGWLRLSPRCTSFVSSSAGGAGPALSRPCLPRCCLSPGDALGSSTVIILSVSSLTSLRTTLQQLSDNPFVM